MKIKRRYNLEVLGPNFKYQFIEIEAEGESAAQIIPQIEQAYQVYSMMLVNGKIS